MPPDETAGPVPEDKTRIRPSPATWPTGATQSGTRPALTPGSQPQLSYAPGSWVDGRYRLEERLGGGGMGVVFKALDRLMDEAQDPDPHVAIKVISDAIREHPQAAIALQREAHRSQSLAHPNIVRVFHFGQDAGSYYLTMELLAGRSLEDAIKARPQGMPLKEAIGIIREICAALIYAHKEGIVHSDIKPSNIFVTDANVAKVLDFGIATPMLNRAGKARETVFDPRRLGAVSPCYSSVEMWLEMEADPRDDVYSAACVFYEILSGRHPFNKRSAPDAMNSRLPYVPIDGLSARRNRALARALAFRREERTPSIARLLADLDITSALTRKSTLAATAAAGFLAAAIAIFLVFRTDDGDAAFARSLVTLNAPLSPDFDQGMVDTLFELADGYLKNARAHYDPGILSEGVSSAYGSYRNILELDPGSRRAAEGVLEVLRLHRAEAHRLFDAGKYAAAVQTLEYGLKINPNSADLQDLRQKALGKLSVTSHL
jgi:serine/threonine protein kinase